MELTWFTDFSQLSLSSAQLTALEILYEEIQSFRTTYVTQSNFGDAFDLYPFMRLDNGSVFNDCRKSCGGIFPNLPEDDKLLFFMWNIAIQEYPHFLVIRSDKNHTLPLLSNIKNYRHEFLPLVVGDKLINLTNQDNTIFEFETSWGGKINLPVPIACDFIISRSFQNCCRKINYGLEEFLNEIESSIRKLRCLAEGKKVEFSLFIGIEGIIFKNINEIPLSDCTVRAVDSRTNPGMFMKLISFVYPENSTEYPCGGIIELKDYVEVKSSINSSQAAEVITKIENCFEKVKFATCFSLMEDCGLVQRFIDDGFPLPSTSLCYPWYKQSSSKCVIIPIDQIENIRNWYDILANITDIKYIYIPLRRLASAINERFNLEDSIIDALIAWEGMFSDSHETTKKVTHSISKILKNPHERNAFLLELKELYGLRSDIVHGRKGKECLWKKYGPKLEELRLKAIMIGLECLKRLIVNDELLKLSPKKRVKKLSLWK